jgi:hypothetical protein
VYNKLVTCGLPDHSFPELEGVMLSNNGAFFGGTHLGNRAEMLAVLQLATATATSSPQTSAARPGSTPRRRPRRTTRCSRARRRWSGCRRASLRCEADVRLI